MNIIIGGLDLSMRHFALVMKHLKTKEMQIYVGWNNEKAVNKWQVKSTANNWNYTFFYLSTKDKSDSKENSIQKAADQLHKQIMDVILYYTVKPTKIFIGKTPFRVARPEPMVIFALEGYAYAGTMVVDLAEITGVIKHLLYKNLEIPYRVHDPQSVKMWAGAGNYDKYQMVTEARKYIDIPEELTKTKNNPGSDVADAYFLMDMLECEIKVRKDPLYLKNLNEKQLQVFNRCTKAFPENLLNRLFVAIKQPELM